MPTLEYRQNAICVFSWKARIEYEVITTYYYTVIKIKIAIKIINYYLTILSKYHRDSCWSGGPDPLELMADCSLNNTTACCNDIKWRYKRAILIVLLIINIKQLSSSYIALNPSDHGTVIQTFNEQGAVWRRKNDILKFQF